MDKESTIDRLVAYGVPQDKAEVLDLRNADLSGANLRRVDLNRADLRSANLRGASLLGASLREADLENANLSEVDLFWADMWKANLRHAQLNKTDLGLACFEYANLWGTDLRGAKNIFNSHDLCAEILKRGANGDNRITEFAYLILTHRNWCWDEFVPAAVESFVDVIERLKEILFADPAWGCEERFRKYRKSVN